MQAMEAARELRLASHAAAGTSHATADFPRRGARCARRRPSVAAQAVLQLPKLPSFRKWGLADQQHCSVAGLQLADSSGCRKQQKEIKPVDDPELQAWLQSQRLPAQRVRRALPTSSRLPCCLSGAHHNSCR